MTQVLSDLRAGGTLRLGDELRSPTGAFKLVLQESDGNIVLLAIDDRTLPWSGNMPDLQNARYLPLWAAGTQHTDGRHLDMQPDGNLVLYNDGSQPVWSTQTNGHDGENVFLRCQDDGNLVVYSNDSALWASSTNARV